MYILDEQFMNKTFGAWLLEQRKIAGLTQAELARRARVSKNYISALENMKPHTVTGALPQPRIEKVDAIAKALGVSVEDARMTAYGMVGSNTSALNDGGIAALFYEYSDMSEEDKADLRTTLEMFRAEIRRRKAKGELRSQKAAPKS